ncbi:MAG: hypothetical protein AABW46_01715, partial [Nanoarchaeota archaeon]
MSLKTKKILILIFILILATFVNAASYPSPKDGTVTYPEDTFGSFPGFTIQANQCPAENIIFKLSSPNNAHAASFNQDGQYSINSCYPYFSTRTPLDFNNDGTFDNLILRLSSNSNAHAEKNTKSTSGYSDVYFGELKCRYIPNTEECGLLDETCVGAISSDTNAHLSDCASAESNRYNKICCQPKCSIKIDHTEFDPLLNINKEIRAIYWQIDESNIFTNARQQGDIIGLKIIGDGICSGKEVTFSVYSDTGSTDDFKVAVPTGFFGTVGTGTGVNCDIQGNCTTQFNSNNEIRIQLSLGSSKFSTQTNYYFSTLFNGQNYFSNLLTVAEVITTGCGNGVFEEDEVCETGFPTPTCTELG